MLFSDTTYQGYPSLPLSEQYGQKKTLLIVRRALNIVNAILSSRNLTYLSRYSIGMELAPYFRLVYHKLQQVVKASSGHFPQPFLIRDVLRTGAKI